MAVSAIVLKDTDFETVIKVTTTGTNRSEGPRAQRARTLTVGPD